MRIPRLHTLPACNACDSQGKDAALPESRSDLARALLAERMAPETDPRVWFLGVTEDITQKATFVEDRDAFRDELYHLLSRRIACLEPPVTVPPAAASLRALKIRDLDIRLRGGRAPATLPAENPDSLAFVHWSRTRDLEKTARAAGLRLLRAVLGRVIDACDRDSETGFDPQENPGLALAIDDARRAGIDDFEIEKTLRLARAGYEDIPLPAEEGEQGGGIDGGIDPALSVPDEMVESALTGHSLTLRDASRLRASRLWEALAESAWETGHPRVFFRGDMPEDTGINGGLVFACNAGESKNSPGATAPAATIDLARCPPEALPHAAAVLTAALETMASGEGRPLVIGFSNLAGFLLRRALPYDSPAARATAALAAAAILGGAAKTSAEIAAALGATAPKSMLRDIKNKSRLFTSGSVSPGVKRPLRVDPALCPDKNLAAAAQAALEEAAALGARHGFRHAHLTGLSDSFETQALQESLSRGVAPLQSLPLLDTRALAPEALAGLRALGLSARRIDDISFHVLGHGTLLGAPHINHDTLLEKGFGRAALKQAESLVKNAAHIRAAFPGHDLAELGFTEEEIAAASLHCCGALTFRGAPHLDPAQAAAFEPSASAEAQILMHAAVQPFLSGAIAQPIALPATSDAHDAQKLMLKAWELGLKSIALTPAPLPAQSTEAAALPSAIPSAAKDLRPRGKSKDPSLRSG